MHISTSFYDITLHQAQSASVLELHMRRYMFILIYTRLYLNICEHKRQITKDESILCTRQDESFTTTITTKTTPYCAQSCHHRNHTANFSFSFRSYDNHYALIQYTIHKSCSASCSYRSKAACTPSALATPTITLQRH